MSTNELPYPYYFYGSHDSLDEDVIISIPQSLMPDHQEDRKRLMYAMKHDYALPFNATLAVIEDGVIVDTIYPKAWVDSLNNALFSTYDNHKEKQVFANPIHGMVKRNKLLAMYRCVRTVLSMLSRSHYRSIVKPILKGCHHFDLKIAALKQLDFRTIDQFNQRNAADVDIWKTIAFYLGQNIALITDGDEFYTKAEVAERFPELKNFIYRKPLSEPDFAALNACLARHISMVEAYGSFLCYDVVMTCNGERIDMRNEVSL